MVAFRSQGITVIKKNHIPRASVCYRICRELYWRSPYRGETLVNKLLERIHQFAELNAKLNACFVDANDRRDKFGFKLNGYDLILHSSSPRNQRHRILL